MCFAWWNHGTVTFDLGPVTFDPEIPFRSVSPERMRDFELVFAGMMFWGTIMCRVVESWRCDLAWKHQGVATFHLCPTY
jgi:hypothetical protein